MPSYPDEAERVQVLRRHDILDTSAEESFDRITRIIAAALNVPIAAVTLVDDERQWFKSRVGLKSNEAPRSASFCSHTMLGEGAMVVSDTAQDARFSHNPLVIGDPHIRFYAGYPLVSSEGLPLGAVCAIDTAPRTMTVRELGLLKDLTALANDQLKLRRMALVDGLTGALRRTAFIDLAERELLLAKRSGSPCSCLMIDVDHFKAINDSHGHDTGDKVLRSLVEDLNRLLRSTDLIGRMGGEEFAVVLPRTSMGEAAILAERLRVSAGGLVLSSAAGTRVSATISIGASEVVSSDEGIAEPLYRADLALLEAKRTRRNRVVQFYPMGMEEAG